MAFTTVVPKQSRSGAVQSGWGVVPGGSTSVQLRALMDAVDLADAALQIQFTIRASFDGGASSYIYGQNQWHGGFASRDGTFHPPSQMVASQPMPTHIRLEAVLPRALSIGLEVEVL